MALRKRERGRWSRARRAPSLGGSGKLELRRKKPIGCLRDGASSMDRDVFLDHLLKASERCRDFTTRFVFDSLPSVHAYWVVLNCSYDGNPLNDDEVVFPDDIRKHGERVGPLTAEAAVSLLWRDRLVPEWIDMTVWEADEHATYFELTCCGRFTSRSDFLYYSWTDVPPFGVKGPAYPPRLAMSAMAGETVEKFSLAESRGSEPDDCGDPSPE
jgi:hypothetical protein